MTPNSSQVRTVVHVINGLGLGGAETMLYNVVRYGNTRSNIRNIVLSLGEGDHFVEPLRALDVEIVELNMRNAPFSTARDFIKLARRADVICSWSYHTSLFSLLPKFFSRARLVWVVRHEDTARDTNKRTTWLVMKMGAVFSHVPDAIAYNGSASMESHSKLGYSSRSQSVLPNGCDTDIYNPSLKSDAFLSEIIGHDAEDTITILSAGRWHPIKDHATFICALGEVVKDSERKTVGVLCGPNVVDQNQQLVDLVEKAGLQVNKDVFLLGSRNDLPTLMASCSLFVLHSRAEAFPNVLVQAMSAGARIVSTDVGIVSELTNGAILPVPTGDASALKEEILFQLNSPQTQLDSAGRTLRQIIIDDYSISSVIPLYEEVILGNS